MKKGLLLYKTRIIFYTEYIRIGIRKRGGAKGVCRFITAYLNRTGGKMQAKEYKFADGLRLVHLERTSSRAVAIGVLTGAGSENENERNNGVSHFLEHMFFKGTKTRSSIDIVKEIDALGAQINAFTAKAYTCFYTFSIDEDGEKCAEILSDILFNSVFDKEELERERKVVLEEISMSDDDNADVCMETASTLYFGDNALARPILGSRDTVKALKREDLLEYVENNYCAETTVIAIIGNIGADKAKKIVEKYFEGRFRSRPGRKWHDIAHITTGSSKMLFKPIEQANIGMVFPGVSLTDKDYLAVNAGGYVFGGGMSSRLFTEVREKHGLAYSVYSYDSCYYDNGFGAVYVGTNTKSALQAVEIVAGIIDDVKKNGFTEEEYRRGIQQAKAGYILGQDSNGALMRFYSKWLLMTDTLMDFDELVAKLDKISYEEFNDIYKKYFDRTKVSLAYVGREIKEDLYGAIKL